MSVTVTSVFSYIICVRQVNEVKYLHTCVYVCKSVKIELTRIGTRARLHLFLTS